MTRPVKEWIGRTDETPAPPRVKFAKRQGPLTFLHIQEYSTPCQDTGCWNWQRAIAANGYGHVRENQKTQTAHRRAYELKHGVSLTRDIDVCHKCDNRACVNPDHLFLGTRRDNMQDCAAKGRTSRLYRTRGEGQPGAKLNNAAVLYIRQSSESLSALARRFGVSKKAVWLVRQRKTWGHVK